MHIEILTIGDELLLGYTIDTNGAHIARQLADLGILVVRRTSVGDEAEAVAAAVREALDRTGAVITTGGLGPTADDRTRESIAAVFGRPLVRDEAIVEWLRELWRSRGWPGELPVSNLQQAMVPEGATILKNNHGSAPGLWLEDSAGRWVAMLPGVPREAKGMLADALIPRLRARLGTGAQSSVVRSRTLRTTGISESKLADQLGPLARGVEGLPLAYLPGYEGVDLRVTASGYPAADADRRLAAAIDALAANVGPHVYGLDDTDLAAVVLQRCRERDLKIAVAESCTGGMLGMRLTAIPGSSDVFLGGTIAYDNLVKVKHLGVRAAEIAEYGAVSEEVATRIASEVRLRFGAEIGIGITGIAGPGGGSPDKPAGTVWVATDLGGDVRATVRQLPGDRHEVRQRATQMALDLVRRGLDRPRGPNH
jgi:nicotinamide-nucleotide amidase